MQGTDARAALFSSSWLWWREGLLGGRKGSRYQGPYATGCSMSLFLSGSHFMDTSALIRLPDDCTVGYIIECKLGGHLQSCPLFHSHLETLQLLEAAQLPEQVTLSYGIFEGKLNVINLHGPFSPEEGPSRFHSLHCLLYPDTPWCLQLVA